MMVDPDGNPIERPDAAEEERGPASAGDGQGEAPQRIDQKWIDSVLGRSPKTEPARAPTAPAPAAAPRPRPVAPSVPPGN